MIELEFLKGIFKFQVSIVYASFFNEVPQHSDLKCHVIKFTNQCSIVIDTILPFSGRRAS